MLKDILLQDEYYLDQLTLFLRNSFGIEEEISSYVSILRQIDKVENDIFKALEVSSQSQLALNIDYINSLNDEVSSIMDMIGAIVGASRNLTLTYSMNIEDPDGETSFTNKEITLNNFEYFVYISCCIFQNGYDGTYKMAKELYDKLQDIGVHLVLLTSEISGTCSVYYDVKSSYGYDEDEDIRYNNRENLYALFFSGLLNLKSMGIIYEKGVVDLEYNNKWGFGIWGITKWEKGEPLEE